MKINILKSILITSTITLILSSKLFAQDTFSIHGISKAHFDKIDSSKSKNIEEYAYSIQHSLEKDGYFLVRVVHHESKIYVDLGTIATIKVIGIESPNKEMVTRYITSFLEENFITLKEADKTLTLINSIPGVSASFSFQRDDKEGTYTIIVTGDEIKQNGAIAVDNIPTRLGKRTRALLSQNVYSAITSGDAIRFQGSYVSGDDLPDQTGYSISYQDELEFNGGYFEITYGDNLSQTNLYSPLTGTTQNDFIGNYVTASFAQPVVVQHNNESFLIAQYNYVEERTENLGDVKLNIFRLSYFDLYHGNNGDSISFGLTLSHGDTLEHYDSNEDNSFNHLRMGVGYIASMGKSKRTEFRAEINGQLGNKEVVASELFFLGSENFLRGYLPGYFIGESGYTGTFELAHAYSVPTQWIQRLTPYVFADYGMVFNDDQNVNNTSREKEQEAYSIGLGAKVYIKNNFFLETWVAKPLTNGYENKAIAPSVYAQLQYNW